MLLRSVAATLAIILMNSTVVSSAPLTVDFYGDSTTAGAQRIGGKTILSTHSEPVIVHSGLKAHFGDDVVVNNFGIGGTQALELLNGEMGYELPWLERMKHSKADVVVLNYSWNDKEYYFNPIEGRTPVSPDEFAVALRELIFIARWAGKEVVLQDPNPGDFDFTKSDKLLQYIEVIHLVAETENVPLVDNFEYVMSIPDWRTYLSEDKIHPTDALYAIKAKRTLETLLPIAQRIQEARAEDNDQESVNITFSSLVYPVWMTAGTLGVKKVSTLMAKLSEPAFSWVFAQSEPDFSQSVDQAF